MEERHIGQLRKLLDILGNATRCRILELLNDRPWFISEISRELEIGQQAILRHLAELEDFGLLTHFEEEETEDRRKGRKRKYYNISPKAQYRMFISIDKDDLIFDLRTAERPKIFEKLDQIEEQIDKARQLPFGFMKLGAIQTLMNRLKEEIVTLDEAKSHAIRLLEKLRIEFE